MYMFIQIPAITGIIICFMFITRIALIAQFSNEIMFPAHNEINVVYYQQDMATLTTASSHQTPPIPK